MRHTLNALAFALVVAVLAPTIAEACAGHRKPVKCTSYTNITGTTRSTCR